MARWPRRASCAEWCGDAAGVSRLYIHGHDEAEGAHRARLPAVPLPGVSAAVQRAARPPMHRSPGPDRHRAARRALAAPRYARRPGRRRAAPPARRRGQPRADPRLGVPRRPAARGSAARDAARPRRPLLVPGRDLRARRRALVLSLARQRPRGGAPRLPAQRAPGDKHAARRVLRRLVDVAERTPQRVTPDAHPPARRAIRWILGSKGRPRGKQSLHNRIEQDHRAVTQRSRPLLGFGSFASAVRCCSAFDARRQDCRVRQRRGAQVPLAEQRRLFVARWRSWIAERQVASWAPRGERLARFVPAPCDLTESPCEVPQGAPSLRYPSWPQRLWRMPGRAQMFWGARWRSASGAAKVVG